VVKGAVFPPIAIIKIPAGIMLAGIFFSPRDGPNANDSEKPYLGQKHAFQIPTISRNLIS
jgi:hypothetical protein